MMLTLTPIRNLLRLRRDESGSPAIEFAFAAPIFFLMVSATIEFGLVMFVTVLMESSLRDASRYGVTGQMPDGASTMAEREDHIRDMIKERTLGLIDFDAAKVDILSYPTFEDVGQGEDYKDGNNNGKYELAFAMPVLIILLLVGIEFTRFVLVNQKVERTSASLADLVSQSTVMTEGGIKNLFKAAKFVMAPFDLSSDGRLIVTSVAASGGPPRIKWQRFYGGGANNSSLGTQGAVANLPDGMVVRDGENVILCETFYKYEPMIFQEIVKSSTVKRFAAFRPRYAALDVIYP